MKALATVIALAIVGFVLWAVSLALTSAIERMQNKARAALECPSVQPLPPGEIPERVGTP